MVAADIPGAARQPRARVTEGLHLGLPNHWFPILYASELGKAPIQVRRFGEDLAVWRDSAGQPHVFENNCPHRGAPLALGRIRGDELACWYHGWSYNAEGACTWTPLEEPGCARVARIRIKTYPAVERAGYIWAFYGPPEQVTPLAVPYELEDSTWSVFRTAYRWKTNWINVLDNLTDPLHAIYLHAGAYTQRRRATFTGFEIVHDDALGFRLGKIGYQPDGSIGRVEGEIEFLLPNVWRQNLADGTPNGILRVMIMPTPVDAGNVVAFYHRARQVSGLQRLRWWLAWHGRLRRAVNGVAAQDEAVMSGMRPIGEQRLREHLGPTDVGVIHLRRRLQRAFDAARAAAASRVGAGAPGGQPTPALADARD
jgi:phenylpropionate dioxygenase-like ring-hydroxylating dioxygenase large terminal subunit